MFVQVLHFLIRVLTVVQFKMQDPQKCNVVCRMVLNAKTAKKFKEKIKDDYRVNM